MSTNARASKKRSDVQASDVFVGEDENGFFHHYLTTTNAVIVVAPDGTRVERQELSPGFPIEQWLITIGDRDGWADQQLYVSFADQFADSVEVR